MLLQQLMEYKVSNSSCQEMYPHGPESHPNMILSQGYPQVDYHLNQLYNLISHLYHENCRAQEELRFAKEELHSLQERIKIHQHIKQQEDSSNQRKEDDLEKVSKPKRKLNKEIKCQLPSCGKKYGSVTALRAHMRIKHLTNDDNLDFVPL